MAGEKTLSFLRLGVDFTKFSVILLLELRLTYRIKTMSDPTKTYITDANQIAQDAFDAGFEGRLSDCMNPSVYADVGENWRIWAENYQAGQRDARSDEMEFLADAQSPDATGQNQWRQDEAVDLDYGYHSQWEY